MARHRRQQLELRGRQTDLPVAHPHLPTLQVDDQIPHPEDGGRGDLPLRPPQDRANPRHQLARAEGLGDVIVRPQLQAQHPILLHPRRQDDDGHPGLPSDGATDVEAIHARQHRVQDDKVGPLPPEGMQRAGAIPHRDHAEPRLLQAGPDHLAHPGLILHHQHRPHADPLLRLTPWAFSPAAPTCWSTKPHSRGSGPSPPGRGGRTADSEPPEAQRGAGRRPGSPAGSPRPPRR